MVRESIQLAHALLHIPSYFNRNNHHFKNSLFNQPFQTSPMSSTMAANHKAHFLIVPFPAQGHLLPLLDLAYLLSTRYLNSLTITIAVTTKNLPLLTPLLSKTTNITPLVLSLPPHPSLPSGLENTHNLPVNYFAPLMHALGGLHAPLLDWAKTRKPQAIIADFFCGWTKQLADDLDVPNYVFSPSGAFAICVLNTTWYSQPKRSNPEDQNELFEFSSIPGSPVIPWCHLPYLYRTFRPSDTTYEFIKSILLSNLESSGFIFNTFQALESRYLDPDKLQLKHGRVWAVGPLSLSGHNSVLSDELSLFLDSCEPKSVVYVCFGSQAVLTDTPAATLATALERSGVRFVWCVGSSTTVPEGFEGRTAGRGVVVRGWAPQVEILNHESVGLFLSHCGWNSLLESMSAGVPVLTWPMTADQFSNARLVKELGIGRVACAGGVDTVPDLDELVRVIVESVGREMRERVMELARKAREAVEVGGSSYEDLEDFVKRICSFDNP